MRFKNRHSNRIFAGLLALLMIVSMIPAGIFTVISATNENLGTITPITTAQSADQNTVIFSGNELEWHPANTDIYRYQDGWWVGIKVTAPEGMTTEEDLADAVYLSMGGGVWSENKSFWNNQDSDKTVADTERYIELWGLLNEQYIVDAVLNNKMIEYTYQFDWDGDTLFEQPITMKVDPTNIKLKKDGVVVYPSSDDDKASVEVITGGVEIGDNKSNLVVAQHTEKTVLQWVEKGNIRPADGWWIGIKVNAPSALTTQADLAGVKYQTKSGGVWSDGKSFWDNQDSDKTVADTARHIELWGMLNETYLENAIANNKNVNYQWRFDWDNDGVYEQYVWLKVDPSKVVLNDKNGEQVYPALATVTPLTGGNVNGTNAKVDVLVEETTLDWSDVNTEIGRNTAGWWVGAKVTAPEYCSAEQLKTAKYKTRVTSKGGTEWSDYTVKEFWANKDSKDTDTVHNMQIWMVINRSLIDTYHTNGKNIQIEYMFDWDADDVYEQTVTMTVVPDKDKIILNRVEQTGFAFEDMQPADMWIGENTYTNIAKGGQGTGAVTYAVNDTTIATVDSATGELTFNADGKEGTVTVTATKAEDDVYKEATATYNLTVNKKNDNFKFEVTKPSDITYKEGLTFTNTASHPNCTGSISYEITASESLEGGNLATDAVATIKDEETGELEIKRSGIITVKATCTGDKKYKSETVEYTLKINRGDPELFFAKTDETFTIIYGDEFENPASALTEVSYASTDDTVAEPNENGELEIGKAGTVTITASVKANEKYAADSVSYDFTVEKATQTVTFANGDGTHTVTFNDNNNTFENIATTNAVKAGENDIECTYTVEKGGEIAEVNKDGKVTIKGAGEIIIKASFNENDRYKSALATYVIDVKKDDQTIAFPKTAYDLITGAAFDAPTADAQGELYGTGAITYTVKDDKNGVVKSIDGTSGKPVFTYEAGTVTVVATKAEDANYNAATAEYTLTVTPWELDSNKTYFNCVGDKNDKNNSWFIGNVSITATDGSVLSFVKTNGEAEWSETLTDVVTEDTAGKEVSFYVKDVDSGKISALQTVEIKKDATRPAVSIKAKELTWEKILNIITFGLWGSDSFDFEVIKDDATSEVASVEYIVIYDDTELKTEEELDDLSGWIDYADKEPVSKDKVFVIYAKVTDNAGNYEYASTNGIVFDGTAPTAEITLPTTETGYYNDDVTVGISVSDKAPYSGINSVSYKVYCDGKQTHSEEIFPEEGTEVKNDPAYSDLAQTWSKDITVVAAENNHDDVVVEVTVTDNAGNEFTTEKELKISVNHPVISTEPIDDPVLMYTDDNDVDYYAAQRKVKVDITGRTTIFEDNLPKINIVAVNSKDENVDDSYAISEWVTVEGETPDEATHTAYITFKGNAKYTYTIEYTDKAGLSAEKVESDVFVVDYNEPTGKVNVNENIWSKILDKLTFGLWSNDVFNISITAEDETSPVKTVEYYLYTGDTALTETDLDGIDEWTVYEDEFEVTEDKQFTVYVRITDYAGNYSYICSDGHILDTAESIINLKCANPNENGYYAGNIAVDITVNDPEIYSGIKKVEYWVNDGSKDTQHAVLYDYQYERDEGENNNGGKLIETENDIEGNPIKVYEIKDAVPTKGDLTHKFEKTVVIDSNLNNTDFVKLTVKVFDNAGNDYTAEQAFKIDITKPTIEISYDNNDVKKEKDGRGYFDANRTAKVVITERTSSFNKAKATEGIVITAVDAAKANVKDSYIIEWDENNPVEGNTPDEATHTAYIKFNSDANYDFSISYTDEAGNKNVEPVETGESKYPYKFTIDKHKPTGTVSIEGEEPWEKLIEVLTFGIWRKDSVDVTITDNDATTWVTSVDYYKTSDTDAKTADDLKKVTDWKEYTEEITVDPNERFTVYVRIKDYLDHIEYISTNGIIVDNKEPDFLPALEDTKPEITLAPVENDINGIYKDDVTVTVKVQDPKVGGTYSGIAKIWYEVYNLDTSADKPTQSGELYDFLTSGEYDSEKVTQDDLRYEWDKEQNIVVDSALNNSNNVVVKVFAIDNAGNPNEDEIALKIDITKPKIDITYNVEDNEVNDSQYTKFFKTARVAKIVITERNFDAGDIDVQITNTDGVIPNIKLTDNSVWTEKKGDAEGNLDDTTYTAIVRYTADGDYTFDISYTDLAGNANEAVNYGSSVEPKAFTIDMTKPTVAVAYDNNDAQNGNYYKAQRTATITIVEHNFDASRVKILGTATDNSVATTFPALSAWTTNGDTHTATILYSADSKYVFDIEFMDMASNSIDDFVAQEFYVDKTMPVVSITGIVDESANADDGNIGFVITATDTNFNTFTPVLTGVQMVDGSFVTKKLAIGSTASIANGQTYTVTNIDTDGVYSITCTVVDMAGNEFVEVILEDEHGRSYTEDRNGNDNLATFSVNRNGSTFTLDEFTQKLVETYYVTEVDGTVTIIEINPDPITESTVTLNGKELVKDTDYSVVLENSNGSWYKYSYKLEKSLFDAEGENNIVVSSKDKAENEAFSDIKNLTVKFVVDKTAPTVAVAGIKTNGRYRVDKQTVTLVPTDDGGSLKSLIVRTVDKNGKVLEELINLSGEELAAAIAEGEITFTLKNGMYQNVQIICEDEAGNVSGAETDEIYTNISITSNAFLYLWANTTLRWSVIAGIVLVAAAIIIFIILKKKKEDK